MNDYNLPPIPPIAIAEACSSHCHDMAVTGLKTGFTGGVLVTAVIFLSIIVFRLTRGVT